MAGYALSSIRLDFFHQSRSSTRQRLHTRLPNQFGSVCNLGPGRTRPYAVRLPKTPLIERFNREKQDIQRNPSALCYVRHRFTGIVVLFLWHFNLYQPGMDMELDECIHSGIRNGIIDLKAWVAIAEKIWILFAEKVKEVKAKLVNMTGAKEFLDSAPEIQVQEEAPESLISKIMGLYCEMQQCLKRRVPPPPTQSLLAPAVPEPKLTLREGYQRFFEYKCGADAPKGLADGTIESYRFTATKLEPIFDRPMDDLTIDELQKWLNALGLCRSIVSHAKDLVCQIYRYCLARKLCSNNPAEYLVLPETKEIEHFDPFTNEDLKVLWANKDRSIVRMILIMCYSGFRITEYECLDVHLEEAYFQGGIKTEAGKDRVVPVHSLILPLLEQAMEEDGGLLCGKCTDRFRRSFKKELVRIGIDISDRKISPHSTRHTFSRLCEKYGVSEADRKRMMGYSFGVDITNGVYGHRTLEELRAEIEKIRMPE